jgi:hypothetical protein
MAVNSFDSAYIQYLSSSSWELLCKQRWSHKWPLRQFKCSQTIVMKVWPRCFDDLFSIWTVSYCYHQFILSTRFLLCSLKCLSTLPHLQKVADLGHSVQLLFNHLTLHLHLVISAAWIQYWVVTTLVILYWLEQTALLQLIRDGCHLRFRTASTWLHLAKEKNWPPLRHCEVWWWICCVPHWRDQCTLSAFLNAASSSPWYLVAKMYCNSHLDWSGQHSDSD